MAKKFVKPSWSVRSVVKALDGRNRREGKGVSMAELRGIKRRQLIEQNPDIDDDELERRLDRIMAAGQRPTNEAMPWIDPPPATVLDGDEALQDAIARRRRRSRR